MELLHHAVQKFTLLPLLVFIAPSNGGMARLSSTGCHIHILNLHDHPTKNSR